MADPKFEGIAGSVSGTRIGPYQVVRPVGEGGMAQVYLATRVGAGGFEKPVVLKVLHSKFLASKMVVEMFLEEARLLARLHHPHIVDVFEVECVGGVPFLAMEHVRGPTLGDLQRFVGRPGPEQVGYFLILVQQLCQALHHAHTLTQDGRPLGLVHRDVSSQNIVIDATTGQAKLIDFGIAKATDSAQHTEIGVLKGKLAFMAPEVLGGARPNPQADIYSVGVLLYRILFARPPYRESDLVTRERPAPFLPFSDLTFPPGIAAVVERAMAVSPRDRYRTASELGDALKPLIDATGAKPEGVAAFLAEVFPRGEADWQRRRRDAAPAEHTALTQLASLSGSLVAAPPQVGQVGRVTRGLALFTVVVGGAAIGLVLLVGALLIGDVVWPADRSAEANAMLDLADQLLQAHNPTGARMANDQAIVGGEIDAATALRAAEQRGRIERAINEK